MSAQVIKGPDNQPLPGLPGGLDIPKDPFLDTPGLSPFPGLCQRAKGDMDAHGGQASGTVTIPPLADGTKITIEWKRIDELHWTCTVKIDRQGKPSESLVFEPTSDATGISHLKATVPPQKGARRSYGPTYLFLASAPGCTKPIAVNYIQRTDSLLDSSDKVIQTSKLGPGIDGGVPYPAQGDAGGSHIMQDTPGISGPEGASDQQLALGDIAELKKNLNVPFAKDGIKAKREFKFWTYVICPEPYKVLGHWEWAFTIAVNSTAPPHLKQAIDQEPTWTADK
ncbi:MAG: hypothetical protein HY244_02425 [Rhizobiales bacterium]|nr:hypothetical protein [Hyphomicrobiales bacterium]